MRTLNNIIMLTSILILYITSYSQNFRVLLDDYKKECQKLDKLYANNEILSVSQIKEIDRIKRNISQIKKKLKTQNLIKPSKIINITSKKLDDNFDLLDFYVYDWSEQTYRIVSRLRCKTKIYTSSVKLRYNFYNNNALVGTDYSYFDYETYGYSGMTPFQISFLETFTDKVDFDSVSFQISYSIQDGTDDIFWDQILEIESNEIVEGEYLNHWFGVVRNKSNFSVKFPKIFACFFKDSAMIDLDHTYLDVGIDSFPAHSTAVFDSYIELPDEYDKIKYYLNYALYSLNGYDNIPPNWPLCTELSYSGKERTNIPFNMFLIDKEDEQIQVQIDWGDNSDLVWSNFFPSRSICPLLHSYTQAGTYHIRIKAKDISNKESTWSDSLKVEILSVNELSILPKILKTGIYKKYYKDTLKVEGGIPPYYWKIYNGELPKGLTLNQLNGMIFGAPTTSGVYDFSIIVEDAGIPSVSDTALFNITINNNPPYLTSTDSVDAFEHNEFQYTARAIDPDDNIIYYDFINYPHWLIPSDSTISGIPSEGSTDTSFIVIASDGELSDTLIVNVTVIPVNDSPKIVNINDFTFRNDQSFSINLDTCVIDQDDSVSVMAWQISPSDTNLKINIENHIAIFTAPNWEGETNVKFKVTDLEGASDSVIVKATVNYPSSINVISNKIPDSFLLEQNYPNPFNMETNIIFGISNPSFVAINIFNLKGERIAEIFRGKKRPGFYTITWNAFDSPSGLYIIKMEVNSLIFTKKCILLK